MVAPIKTTYDTAVELALLSIDSDDMNADELLLEVYRKASKFSAVLADPDVIESIRYVEHASIRQVRVVEVSEDGSYICVEDPEDESVDAVIMAEVEEAAEAAMIDDVSEISESVEEKEEEKEEEAEDAEEEESSETAEEAPAEEVSVEPVLISEPKHAEKEYEKLQLATGGIFGADVASVLPDCVGKICDVYIGIKGHYSLMDTYSKELVDKVIKIEIVGE